MFFYCLLYTLLDCLHSQVVRYFAHRCSWCLTTAHGLGINKEKLVEFEKSPMKWDFHREVMFQIIPILKNNETQCYDFLKTSSGVNLDHPTFNIKTAQ